MYSLRYLAACANYTLRTSNAILCAHIRVGTTREQFRTQVTDALAPRSRSESSLLATTKSRGEGAVSESEPCASSSQHESTGSSTDPMTLTPSAQTVLEERRKRLAADEVAKTAQQKLDRNGRTDAPRQEDQEASLGFSNPELLAHMQEQQRRLADAKQERRRILRAIEYDRQQRRERTEMRRALAASNTDVDGTAPPRRTVATTNASSECTVKVRLFDGRTITSHFDPMQTLRSHVRPWIDCNRNDDGIPFNFRQIHTPLSNRLITISEEDQPLEATGLCPGANLIMVPVQNFTTAYKQVPTSLYKSLSYSYNVIADRVGRLSALLGSVTGPFLSSGPNTASEANTSVNRVTSSPRKNSSTEDEQDEQQLYNGNQVVLPSRFIPLIV